MTKISSGFLFLLLVASNCSKSGIATITPASVTIVNALPQSQPIIPVFSTTDTIQYYSNAQAIGFGQSLEFSPAPGQTPLYIVQNEDTTNLDLKAELFSGTFSFVTGRIYSLFISGDTTKADTLLVNDNVPYYSDSSAGVRFVNLVSGGLPLNIQVVENGDTVQVESGFTYKQITPFQKYPATAIVGGAYSFVFTDPTSGNPLYGFSWSFSPYRNYTVVIAGFAAGVQIQPFQINNY